jgi:hypothetical protein
VPDAYNETVGNFLSLWAVLDSAFCDSNDTDLFKRDCWQTLRSARGGACLNGVKIAKGDMSDAL